MAAEVRQSRSALIGRLQRDSRRFDFVTAAILLHRLFATKENPRPFRYVARTTFAYPSASAELESLPDAETGEPGHLRVGFMGLTGLTSPLPAHYTELVEARARSHDPTLRSFLALFEDRFARMLLETHVRQRFWLSYAWRAGPCPGEETDAHDPFVEAALSLIGTRSGDLRDRVGIPASAQVYYAGLLSQQPRSATALASMVGDMFQAEAHIESFRGKWITVPSGTSNSLSGGSMGGRLGQDFVLGDRFFDPAAGFLLSIGPLPLEKARDLMPGQPGAKQLQRFVRFAAGPTLEFDYQLLIDEEDAPPGELVAAGDVPQRLGCSFWLRSGDDPLPVVAGPFPSLPIDSE